ncbi:ABC transporter permease [Jiangella alkaliphila]|nr:ABC transporter permease [Jiangella alkaliphila]
MTPRRALTAVGNETVKGLRHGWSERLQILIEMPLFIIFVLLLGYTTGKGDTIAATGALDWSIDTSHASWLIIGMVVFIYTYLHVQKMFWRFLAEIQTGTLEQTYLSPLPSWVHVVAGRIAAAIAETAVVAGVVYAVTSLFVRIDLHWRPAALVPLALLITGAAGLAMIIAGITLVWKRIQLLNDLILMLIFFFSGAALPLADMPSWAQDIGKPIFMTHATEAIRIVMVDGDALAWAGTGGWAWTLATATGWFLAGLTIFHFCERIALRRGSLSRF